MRTTLEAVREKYMRINPANEHEVYKQQLALLCAVYNNSLDAKYEELLCGITILLNRCGKVTIESLTDEAMVNHMSEQLAMTLLSHWATVFPTPWNANPTEVEKDLNRRRVIKKLVQMDARLAFIALRDLALGR